MYRKVSVKKKLQLAQQHPRIGTCLIWQSVFHERRLNTMAETVKIEKFAANELTSLRDELTRSGIDLWQAGEVLSAFLAGRGYGVIPEQARDAVLRLEGPGCSHECIQLELERVALVM
jgi:hypothetical protein